jgi:5-methyltetrahydropteroyltriglutamate--homocysteine methyltransferase
VDRILTTHVGSLPRPPALRDLLVRQDRGEPVDESELARETEAAVRWAVDRQLSVGIDIGNAGEQPRVGFSTYVARRMRGFSGESQRRLARDLGDPTRVIASTDCGFGSFAGSENVTESVVWAKLGTLVDGAALATARLWGRR